MTSALHTTAKALTVLRHQHAAWQLLASRRAPLVLACLQPLFEQHYQNVLLEDAEAYLAETFADFANDDSFAFNSDNYPLQARRELRDWIKKGLLLEREGELLATDALQRVLQFISGLSEQRLMTSTASRLATVQREIDNLSTDLNPDPDTRRQVILSKIEKLKAELAEVDAGQVTTLSHAEAVESIQNIYALAMSLRDDFRRVEGTYRQADRELRQQIVQSQTHRGQIVDQLLDSHDNLLETAEGQVFHHFHQQLQDSVRLDQMKLQLRYILYHESAHEALTTEQQSDLRLLIMRLTLEAGKVGDARARSERDVRGFLQTGLVAEHHRVGQLLNEIFEASLAIDWQQQAIRRQASVLPPIAIALGNVPLIQRLRYKTPESKTDDSLALSEKTIPLADLDNEFWQAFDSLDRKKLVDNTLTLLRDNEDGLTLSELAACYVSDNAETLQKHDLEVLSVWLSMAREADIIPDSNTETIDIGTSDDTSDGYRFSVPGLTLNYQQLQDIDWDI
ncbi:MAG: hypothetical protein CR975_04645 [Gammaproteobacteria bacterium]|nr:MAG: hypothetical protein CR975_04645 [Gammaproteobacteria bacterium]